MRKRWPLLLFKVLLFATIAIAGCGQAVLQLWNILMPQIFGLPRISFWQAVGLMSLSWILFGGWRGWGGAPSRRPLSAEQRMKLRAGLERTCGARPVTPVPDVEA